MNFFIKFIRYKLRRIKYLLFGFEKVFQNKKNSEIFNEIYQNGFWGKSKDGFTSSGEGSHNPKLIFPYIKSVKNFLLDQDFSTIVDIGCGDFNVGSRIAPLFSNYVGIDVVESLIERNKKKFQTKSISFECKDITTDNLPSTDLVCVRQVLQHLSNSDIHKFLNNMNGKCKFLLITETMHKSWRFRANKDMKTGPGVRYHLKSGVVLDAPPFNLSYKQKSLVCEPFFRNEHVVSTLYKF